MVCRPICFKRYPDYFHSYLDRFFGYLTCFQVVPDNFIGD